MKQQCNVYSVQNHYLIDMILSTKCLTTKIFRNRNISLSNYLTVEISCINST